MSSRLSTWVRARTHCNDLCTGSSIKAMSIRGPESNPAAVVRLTIALYEKPAAAAAKQVTVVTHTQTLMNDLEC